MQLLLQMPKGHTFPPLSIIPQDVISNQITRE